MIETFKKMWKFAGSERKNMVNSVILGFFYAVFGVFEIATIYMVLTNIVAGNKSPVTAAYLAGVVIAGTCGKALLRYFSQLKQTHASYFMVANKRIGIADKLKKIPMGYFSEYSLGRIAGVTTTVLETTEMLSARIMVLTLSGLINSIVFGIFVFIYDYRIGAIVFLGTAIFIFVTSLTDRKSRCLATDREKSQAKMVETLLEYIRGMTVVKSFGLSGRRDSKVQDALEYNYKSSLNLELAFTPYLTLQAALINVFNMLVMSAGVYFFTNGTMSLTAALMCVVISFIVFSHIQSAGSAVNLLRIVSSSMDEVTKIEEIPELSSVHASGKIGKCCIEFENVGFAYDERQILENISLKIPENTTTAIVGQSGSGKTTLCNLIARFWDVQQGAVKIGGVDIRQYPLEELMKNISMVMQNVYLFADTIENNIKFGNPSATRDQVIEAAKKAACHDFIMDLEHGYDTMVEENAGNLSGGEKQRISIARALLKDAKIILLDEISANVDPENEDKLQLAIEALTHNKTIIMIAHRVKTVENADKIIVLDAGNIAQQGTHEQLVAQDGIYKRFIDSRHAAAKWKVRT